MNQNIVINTYNESSLHKTLKNLYAIQNNGKTEIQFDGYIYDVITEDGSIIEIQTKNLSKLMAKLSDSLNKGYKIKLVHPVIITKRILTYDSNENLISDRKSPKKGSIYDIFKELTGIYPILLHKNFTLEILEITMIEKRLKLEQKDLLPSKKSRFKRDWKKIDKSLDQIVKITEFKTKQDYIDLLPDTLPDEFSSKNLTECLKKTEGLPRTAYNQAHLLIWVLSRMELIEQTKVEKRLRFFKIKE